jgi:hypothetical protein
MESAFPDAGMNINLEYYLQGLLRERDHHRLELHEMGLNDKDIPNVYQCSRQSHGRHIYENGCKGSCPNKGRHLCLCL